MTYSCLAPDCPATHESKYEFCPTTLNETYAKVAAFENSYHSQELHRLGSQLNAMSYHTHRLNKPFYLDIHSGLPIERNLGELLMLIVSEVAEVMEGVRKSAMDDKLPNRKAEEVELADVLIRLLDYAGYRKLDLAGAFIEKLAYNRIRKDHTHAARREMHGKKF